MCFFGAKHQTPFETIKIPQFWHIGDLFRPFRLAAMTIFPEKGRISEMAIFAFVDFTKFLKIIKLTFFENFKQFLGSSPISICILRGPGWFFTKNLDHPIFPSEIAWMPSYTHSRKKFFLLKLWFSNFHRIQPTYISCSLYIFFQLCSCDPKSVYYGFLHYLWSF